MSANLGAGLESAAVIKGASSQILNDRYRLPDRYFDVVFNERLSSDAGFFRFGSKDICYGRTSEGTRAGRPEFCHYNALRDITVDDKTLCLPFDPKEIIENLCLERYTKSRGMPRSFMRFFKRLYYYLRPLTNLAIRKQVQRFHARNWEKWPFPHWPVDTTVENVLETILLLAMKAEGIEEVPFVWLWPQGASACLTMTHDVESSAGLGFCESLMNVDDSYGMKSAFGIVPEERYEVSPAFLESIRHRGFEVAVQDLNHDGRLYDHREEFLRRATIINRYGREFGAKGFRAAVLYRRPEWYEALEFDFDMSSPNVAPMDPQHGGCCTVMPFFIGNMLELPLTTTQDYTLFHVLNDRSIDLWKSQIDLVLGKNGLLSFIVHPDYLLEPDTLATYKNLMGHLQELRKKTSIWCALPSEINTWWRMRSKMSVVKDGASWRVVGEGAERAVLAYARNIDGKLVYELSRE